MHCYTKCNAFIVYGKVTTVLQISEQFVTLILLISNINVNRFGE